MPWRLHLAKRTCVWHTGSFREGDICRPVFRAQPSHAIPKPDPSHIRAEFSGVYEISFSELEIAGIPLTDPEFGDNDREISSEVQERYRCIIDVIVR